MDDQFADRGLAESLFISWHVQFNIPKYFRFGRKNKVSRDMEFVGRKVQCAVKLNLSTTTLLSWLRPRRNRNRHSRCRSNISCRLKKSNRSVVLVREIHFKRSVFQQPIASERFDFAIQKSTSSSPSIVEPSLRSRSVP